MEKTLIIIKPDGVRKNITGKIITYFEREKLRVAALKKLKLTRSRAAEFYAVHKEQPFFNRLLKFMVSGPVVVAVIEGKNAIARARSIMGATNPPDALPGTIRAEFGENNTVNAAHGSDSPRSAEKEINFFFKKEEIF